MNSNRKYNLFILGLLFLCSLTAFSQESNSKLSKESQDFVIDVILERANLALQRNNYLEAQKILSSAKEIAVDSTIQWKADIFQANFYSFTGQLDQAANQVNRLSKVIPESNESYIDLILVKADVLTKQGDYLKADQSLKQANLLVSQSQDPSVIARIQFLRAELFLKTKNTYEATSLYQDVIPKLKEQQLFYYEAKARFNLAQAYFDKTDLVNADLAAEDAIATATNFGFKAIEIEGYLLKSQIAKGLGNLEETVEFLDRYIKARENYTGTDSSIAENPSTLLASINALKEANEALKAENAEQASTLKGRGHYSILLFVMLTLLSLLTMSLFKNNKLRARSNQALEGKNSALIDERDRAQDAAKIKADFLSTITHELRTPMYAVTGLTHLLLESNPRGDQEEHLQTLQSSGEYLLSLIDNILDFNKLEANKVELESIPFDLKKRVEDIAVSLTNQAKDQQNNLSLQFDKAIPSRVKGDPVKISQILINLVGNAIKFTKSGNIWIRVNRLREDNNQCLIQFEVEDNGKGISEEKQQDIFNNFTQEGTSITREYGGTGLGLAIVKNLVGLMGSEVKLDSKVGRGSIFSFEVWLELPDSNKFYEENKQPSNKMSIEQLQQSTLELEHKAETKEAEDIVVNDPETIPAIEEPTQKNTAAGKDTIIKASPASPKDLISKKILIVEDNKINQMITRKILEGKNFECDIANNGVEALGKARDNKYDLILMDIHMPAMDGKQATAEIRKFDREIPIIALTAVTLDETEKEFYEIGFDDIIPKPFKMEEFFEKIQKAFSSYQIY
ncbi:tetratricopeptide repeat-containing hybrid sensor histidine kinase/response regulator [Nonlabens ponticola]|uniref:tetratricopeptide repeat-containing hybrid sensor histidine kinase/response regulator n=1 Tax=Nonlabens ponticola TaxID=2496866 RepID=UPI001F4A0590|nr:ATP-binding protein [Nonlabens ponticola]